MDPLIVRWDRTVIHPDPNKPDDPTIVCCLTADAERRPVALMLDDEYREALGLALVDPDAELDQADDESATAFVYRERHHLIAHLAAAYPSVMVLGADADEPDWPIIYITLPTGQVSWHIAPGDMDLFLHVPIGEATWDGSDVFEKYRRLDEHTTQLAGKDVAE